MKRSPVHAVVIAALVLLVGASCCAAPTVHDGKFHDDQVAYAIGEPGAGWERVDVKQANAAWHSAALSSSLLVNSHCEGVGDAPLEALTNDLMIGMTERDILEQQKLPFSRREAIETVALGKLDGVPRKLALFVLKKDGCVYDIVLEAAPERFDEARAAYERVKGAFDVGARPGRS